MINDSGGARIQEGVDALSDARPARIVDADEGGPDLHCHVHGLADLLRVHLAERAAYHGEILGKDVDEAAIHRAIADDHSLARGLDLGHAEIGASMLDKGVKLDEGTCVDQGLDPFAGGLFTFGMLRRDSFRSAAGEHFGPTFLEPF